MLNFGCWRHPRPKWIPGIYLGQLGWSMGSNVWSAGPEIEKYHEFNNQISLFQQKDQKISGGHVTYIAPCHWFKSSSPEEYIILGSALLSRMSECRPNHRDVNRTQQNCQNLKNETQQSEPKSEYKRNQARSGALVWLNCFTCARVEKNRWVQKNCLCIH